MQRLEQWLLEHGVAELIGAEEAYATVLIQEEVEGHVE
jgi:hypothetical protein